MRISDWSSDVCSSDLPFLLEALVTAVVGVALAAGALAAFQYFAIQEGMAQAVSFLPWVGWDDYFGSLIGVLPPGIVYVGPAPTVQIGRDAGRERVCQYGSISGGAVSLKKQKTQ